MDVNIQLVLSSMKLSQILRVKEIKDPIVNTQGVIYTFEWDLSYANYVDQTIRHLINDIVSIVNLLSELKYFIKRQGLEKRKPIDRRFQDLKKMYQQRELFYLQNVIH